MDILDLFLDAFKDTVCLLPYLFFTYLILEILEKQKQLNRLKYIRLSKKQGPFWGALCGLIPQCGFSIMASNFYATRLISLGALMAVFLATSDEMLPVLISKNVSYAVIGIILAYKFIGAVLIGFVIDIMHPMEKTDSIQEFCAREHCHCHHHILKASSMHTLKIGGYLFLFTFLMNILIAIIPLDKIQNVVLQMPILSKFITAAIGIIPNCYPSVFLTQIYLEHFISLGSLLAGTFANAGLGLLVLYRVNPNKKEVFMIIGLLYIISVGLGIIFDFIM